MRHGRHYRSTVAHSDIANDMLAIHGLSGAGTVHVATTAWHWQGNFHQISKTGRFSLSKHGVDKADEIW